MKTALFLITFCLGFVFPVWSMTPAEEKLLFQTLGEIKGELKQIRQEMTLLNRRIDDTNRRIDDLRADMNKRFEQVDKQFEQVDKRFEQIDKRFEQIDKRFEDLKRYAGWIIGGVFTLIAAFVTLLIWDRRTAVRSALKEMDRDYQLSKLVRLLDVLRERAKTDQELAAIMRNFGLL